MSDPDRDLTRIQQGRRAETLLQEFGPVIEDKERGIINRICKQLADGEVLDPQQAIQAWIEIYSLHSVKRSLEQRRRMGQSAGERMRDAT